MPNLSEFKPVRFHDPTGKKIGPRRLQYLVCPRASKGTTNHGNYLFLFILLSESQTEGTGTLQNKWFQNGPRARQNRSLEDAKSLPEAPKSVPGGPGRLLESFQRTSWSPEGSQNAPRGSQRTILTNLEFILESFWGHFWIKKLTKNVSVCFTLF